VITGYNTDIEFDGIVYHVQTEDKGVASPVIMSLVYNRGTILASKRAPYDDLLNGSLDERALAERLQRQHKLICAAVSAGRIEDLKEMSARNLKSASAKRSAKKNGGSAVETIDPVVETPAREELQAETRGPEPTLETPKQTDSMVESPQEAEAVAETSSVEAPIEITNAPDMPAETYEIIEPSPTPVVNFVNLEPEVKAPPVDLEAETRVYSNLLSNLDLADIAVPPIAKPEFAPLQPPTKAKRITLTGHDQAPDDEPMILIDAVEAVSDLAGRERPESHKLSVDIIGDTKFKGGERKDVYIMVCRGSSRKVVPRAEVMVKVLGASFRPVICHAVTDGNGLATINLKIPQFQTGRATVIARAISEGEEVEIRQAVAHG